MKIRFTTIDIIAIVKEITKNYVGHRVTQIYDIDNKTFLLKLSKSGEEGKSVLLIESGIRIHITDFQWPKNASPSGFSMKLRKHIKNKRLESISQIGSDRILDLQFGTNECAFHLIVELYDRGNIILTDYEYCILNLVRPRIDNSTDLKFITKEKYPIDNAKIIDYQKNETFYLESLEKNIQNAKTSDNIRKICSSLFAYGPNLLEHCVLNYGLSINTKLSVCLKDLSVSDLVKKLFTIFLDAQQFVENFKIEESKGYIFGKQGDDKVEIFEDFHPIIFQQMSQKPFKELPYFNQAVDEYFSVIESQKSEQQVQQKEKTAMKKLENIKLDHQRRLTELRATQEIDVIKGEFITMNIDLVNRAILILNHAIANKISWQNIQEMVDEGKEAGDPIAQRIQKLNFENNEFNIRLTNVYKEEGEDEDNDEIGDEDKQTEEENVDFVNVDIDLSMNAYENTRRYFTMKKQAKAKEDKTVSATDKAFKSAEAKTKQMLKEVQTVAKINKMRKVNWFEKFNWFISSENYLVVGGKDQQQNELLVKRYMRQGDVYVHADIHGASTVIIKNHEYPTNPEIPPKTLTEAGQMAVVYSGAWDSKISVAAWWVRYDQVSKTAPTGEYLTTGSFMIRGKKNYLPTSILTFGFGILFKMSDESMENHKNDRRVKVKELEEDVSNIEEVEELICEDNDNESSDNSDADNNFPDVKVDIDIAKDCEKIDISETKQEQITKVESVTSSNDKIDQVSHKYMTAKDRRQKQKNSVSLDESSQITNENGEIEVAASTVSSEVDNEAESINKNGPLKRGQRSKLKKMKKKYKDQDEEDRDLRVAVIQGKNPYLEGENLKPLTKKQKRKQEEEFKKLQQQEKLLKKQDQLQKQKEHAQARAKQMRMNNKDGNVDAGDCEDDEEEEEEVGNDFHQQQSQFRHAVDSLTGIPLSDDELLYALAVLAPYQTLQNYKYKIKMIPGTTKRGKAGKTALFNFIMDKNGNPREKELLKALKDQDVTRNFPGRVKIFTQNLKKSKK